MSKRATIRSLAKCYIFLRDSSAFPNDRGWGRWCISFGAKTRVLDVQDDRDAMAMAKLQSLNDIELKRILILRHSLKARWGNIVK